MRTDWRVDVEMQCKTMVGSSKTRMNDFIWHWNLVSTKLPNGSDQLALSEAMGCRRTNYQPLPELRFQIQKFLFR